MNELISAENVLTFALPLLAAVLVSWAVFLWFAAGLFRILRRAGDETWRAWIPVVSQGEVFRLGGFPRWTVFLFFIPVVNLVALIHWIRAVHRINREAGRGAGNTVLGVLLPPVWITVLGWSGQREEEVVQMRGSGPATGSHLPPEVVHTGDLRGGAVPAAPLPGAVPGALPGAVPIALPGAVDAPPPAFPPAMAQPLEMPSEVFLPPQELVSLPTEEPVDSTRLTVEETVLVSSPQPPRWELVTDSGEVHRLTASTVVIGRNPLGEEPGVQYLTLKDNTRTLSKHHAVLEERGGIWSVTDLGSTNGVSLTGPLGDTLVQPETAIAVEGPFKAGMLGLRLRQVGEER